MLPETLPLQTDPKPRLRLGVATAPRATCASRHSAITRELSSYSKYKRWAESQRHGWPAESDEEK
jgi:hypothetical protein